MPRASEGEDVHVPKLVVSVFISLVYCLYSGWYVLPMWFIYTLLLLIGVEIASNVIGQLSAPIKCLEPITENVCLCGISIPYSFFTGCGVTL